MSDVWHFYSQENDAFNGNVEHMADSCSAVTENSKNLFFWSIIAKMKMLADKYIYIFLQDDAGHFLPDWQSSKVIIHMYIYIYYPWNVEKIKFSQLFFSLCLLHLPQTCNEIWYVKT